MCHSQTEYALCCQPYHLGERRPATAAELMRSRYSAYAAELPKYIIETTHATSPHWQADGEAWRREIVAFCRSVKFVSLKIRDAVEQGDRAEVEFRAGLTTIDGRDASFVERSKFVRQAGIWYYT